MLQFVPIASGFVTGHYRKEPGHILQVFCTQWQDPPKPFLFQAQESQVSQLFLICELSQSFHQLLCPCLSLLQSHWYCVLGSHRRTEHSRCGHICSQHRDRITSLTCWQPRIPSATCETRAHCSASHDQTRPCRFPFLDYNPPEVKDCFIQSFLHLMWRTLKLLN